jgi:hypothetical protein
MTPPLVAVGGRFMTAQEMSDAAAAIGMPGEALYLAAATADLSRCWAAAEAATEARYAQSFPTSDEPNYRT